MATLFSATLIRSGIHVLLFLMRSATFLTTTSKVHFGIPNIIQTSQGLSPLSFPTTFWFLLAKHLAPSLALKIRSLSLELELISQLLYQSVVICWQSTNHSSVRLRSALHLNYPFSLPLFSKTNRVMVSLILTLQLTSCL